MKTHSHTRHAIVGVVAGAFLGAVSLMTMQGASLSANVLSADKILVAPGTRLSPRQVRLDQRRNAAAVKPVATSASSVAATTDTPIVIDGRCIVATEVANEIYNQLTSMLPTSTIETTDGAKNAALLTGLRTKMSGILKSYCLIDTLGTATTEAPYWLGNNRCAQRFDDDELTAEELNDCNLATQRKQRYAPR